LCTHRPEAASAKNDTSALMRSAHDLHRTFNVTPFPGFVGIAFRLATLRVLRRLRNRFETMLLKHLPCDGMNLQLGYHGALLKSSGWRAGVVTPQPTNADPACQCRSMGGP